jgi:hypothetical protein
LSPVWISGAFAVLIIGGILAVAILCSLSVKGER